jgi:hypothetical protein
MGILHSMKHVSCTKRVISLRLVGSMHVKKSALIFTFFEKNENAYPVMAANFKSMNHL